MWSRKWVCDLVPSCDINGRNFLSGKNPYWLEHYPGGRAGDPPRLPGAERLRDLPLRVGRLKTGTPPRIDGRTIDYSRLQEQAGDKPTPVMSYLGKYAASIPNKYLVISPIPMQRPMKLLPKALIESPLYTGKIEGIGPRYCPSIEDKIKRFADAISHQVFLEPEGLKTHEVYPNGISTSLSYARSKHLCAVFGIGKCAYYSSWLCD